jgi:C4-dicarboxylate-specific signal transduction histidine kinase
MAAHPPESEVERTTLEMWRMLGTRSIEELVDLPRMSDPEIEAAMEILSRLYIPAYYSDNNLLCLHLCHAVILSLGHGNAPPSSHAYGWFGVILITLLRRPREGYRFAKLGFDLVEHDQLVAYRARAHMHMKIATYWTGSIDEALSHTRAAFAAARESGDVPIACFACSEVVHAMVSRGDQLGDVEAEIARGREVVRRAGFTDIDELLVGNERLVRALRGATRSIATFDDEGFSEVEFESRLAWDRQPSLVFFYLTTKLMARFLALDYEAAFSALERARPLLWAGLFAVQSHWFHFFSALTLAALWERLPVGQREEWLSSHSARLREWAEVNPAMFECDHLLVSAEIARARGEDAARLYDQAIAAAEKSALVQRAALANELASEYYRQAGFVFIANSYLREARARYARWGADGKVRAIDHLHPDLVGDTPAIVAATPAELDVIAIAKASQAIASELMADRVGSTLLEVVLEHGGAQRGCLFLPRGPELLFRAEATVDAGGSRARVVSEHPLELCASVPISLLQLARRTGQPVLLADAREEPGHFASDVYIARERPRSVLALPVQRKSELVALLYLENSLVVGAFTSERLTALRLLVTQAAISFENASLFAKEQAAVALAEEQRRRSSLIAQATALLVEPVGHEEALRRLAHLCVRDLADRCVIELMVGDEMQRLCEASVHPVREPREESELRLPLVARGRTLGALSLGFSTRPRSDMELALQLADRAALALDNERLRLEQRTLRERLEQADRLSSLGTLAAGIGHEINNPLTYIAGNLSVVFDALSRGRGGEVETREALSDAMSGAARIRHIVSGLKQFSRQGRQERAPVDVRAELGTALDMTRGEVTRRARLSVDIPPSLPLVVAAPTELGQVFVNLLVNAAQAFPERRTASDTVTVSARALEDRVVVEVRDTGAGIPGDILKRIFDPFFTTKPAGVGTGLGLSICHRIVIGIGGNIEVESRPGEGTCFRVVLPVSRPEATLG